MACFVDAPLMTRSIFTPLISSSMRPSSNACLTLTASFRASRARLRFDEDGEDEETNSEYGFELDEGVEGEVDDIASGTASRSASASSFAAVAIIEHLRHTQSVSTSNLV